MLGLSVLSLALYLPYALKGGWYYDDWALYETFHRAGSSWSDQLNACTSYIPAGRKLTCLYHVTEFHFLGSHRFAYHLVAIAFLVAMSVLVYVICRRCRLAWQWSALIAALLVLFPASDSTRLWPTGAIGEYVIVLELTGVLLALGALARPRRFAGYVLHVLAAFLFIVAMASYEITVPLVALNGIVYWLALRNRAALWRGAVDFLLAVGFVAYRLVVAPAAAESGFNVHRTLGGDLHRGWNLVSTAWATWHETFLPGALGTIGVIAVLAITSFLYAREPKLRVRLLPWLALLAASLMFAGAATFVFLTANDLYVPQVNSAFNRVTLPASIAYVGIFVALVGLGYEIVRRFSPPRYVAAIALVAVLAASGIHQLRISSDHKRAWEASWDVQKDALAGYAAATRQLPDGSRIVGLGTPIWEEGFVPIFAANWDLGNAIAYTSGFESAGATPLTPEMTCGHRGLTYNGVLSMPYRVPGQPLYFIDSTSRSALRVTNQIECRQAIARWGRPPLFAPAL